MKIALLTTLGKNVGDEFIREGIKAILDRLLKSYEPLYINKHNSETLFSIEADEVRQYGDKYFDCDIFIQCGAPVYWHLFDGVARSINSEWHKWLWEQRVLNGKVDQHPWFMNLGAGSCQPWGDDGNSFINDKECTRFARLAGYRAEITVVRDPLAQKILSQLGVPSIELPCPAFLAAERHQPYKAITDTIGINIMRGSGHFKLDPSFDQNRWEQEVIRFINILRKEENIIFIAHDKEEAEFQSKLAEKNERVFFSNNWHDYLDMYSTCMVVVANRVHGAVCASGFGVPSIIIGNDSRSEIGCFIGLPIIRAAEMNAEQLFTLVKQLLKDREIESSRLLELRKETIHRYIELLTNIPPFKSNRLYGQMQRYHIDRTKEYYFEDISPIGKSKIEFFNQDMYYSETGLSLTFGIGGNAYSLVKVAGFSNNESWGVWSDANIARSCSISFPHQLPVDFIVEINAITLGTNRHQKFRLQVGTFETEFYFGVKSCDVSLNIHHDGSATFIKIFPLNPCSPKELGISNDDRLLGIGLCSLTIKGIKYE